MRWKKSYVIIFLLLVSVLSAVITTLGLSDVSDAKAETYYEDIEKFPESYKVALYKLKDAHPNWTFEVMNTGLDWNTVVYNEMTPASRSLVPSYFDSSFAGEYYGDGWSCATRAAVEYYLDPRNWLTEDYIFQFEKLTYNANTQGIATVQKVLANTFMSGYIEGYEYMGLTYAQAFRDIGASIGVSPVHLATRVYQEQGAAGSSDLISGTYPGYEGYYNYYNIQASGSTHEQIVINGLNEAKSEGWNSRYGALLGGSKKVGERYILRGQDTLYLQKFDVDGSYDGRYWHQYMQNLAAPSNEGRNIKRAYEKAGMLGEAFVFKIPVYYNMPNSIENGIEFVERLYLTILGRQCTEAESKDWATALSNSSITCSETVLSFVCCDEYQQRDKKISNKEYIYILYHALLNREPVDAEIEGWLEAFKNNYSRKYILKQFTDSSEFVQLCNGYGLEVGKIEINSEEIFEEPRVSNEEKKEFSDTLISKLYIQALNREAASEEVASWSNLLVNGSISIERVFYSFIFSDEFISRNLANEEFINTLYMTMLCREAGEQEVNGWIELLNQHYSRKYIFSQFDISEEFVKIYSFYEFATERIEVSQDEIYDMPDKPTEEPTDPSIPLPEDKDSVMAYIKNLYINVLSREASDSEVNSWCDMLYNGAIDANSLVYSFVFSEEFSSRNPENSEFIKVLYRAILCRECCQEEIECWIGLLDQENGKMIVVDAFLSSEEFKQLAQEYGLVR